MGGKHSEACSAVGEAGNVQPRIPLVLIGVAPARVVHRMCGPWVLRTWAALT